MANILVIFNNYKLKVNLKTVKFLEDFEKYYRKFEKEK